MVTYTNFVKHCKNLIKRSWCKGFFAKTIDNKSVEPTDSLAHGFCLVGAAHRTNFEFGSNYIKKYRKDCESVINKGKKKYVHIEFYNDKGTTKKHHILKLLDKVIDFHRKEKNAKSK